MSDLTDDTIRRMMDEATAPGLFVGASHTEIAAHQRIYVLCDALLAMRPLCADLEARYRRLEQAARGFWQAYMDGTLYEESANEVCETFMAMLAEADQ